MTKRRWYWLTFYLPETPAEQHPFFLRNKSHCFSIFPQFSQQLAHTPAFAFCRWSSGAITMGMTCLVRIMPTQVLLQTISWIVFWVPMLHSYPCKQAVPVKKRVSRPRLSKSRSSCSQGMDAGLSRRWQTALEPPSLGQRWSAATLSMSLLALVVMHLFSSRVGRDNKAPCKVEPQRTGTRTTQKWWFRKLLDLSDRSRNPCKQIKETEDTFLDYLVTTSSLRRSYFLVKLRFWR